MLRVGWWLRYDWFVLFCYCGALVLCCLLVLVWYFVIWLVGWLGVGLGWWCIGYWSETCLVSVLFVIWLLVWLFAGDLWLVIVGGACVFRFVVCGFTFMFASLVWVSSGACLVL